MKAVCATCGATIRATAPAGQCPRCLLALARQVPEEIPTAPDSEPGELLTPAQVRCFGDYKLIEEIARGGMGVVYRARQISLNRPVAVKMILAGQLATLDSVQRFQLEARAAAKLEHRNIVPIYEVGEHETQHYFTMKYIKGGSLADRIADFRLPSGENSPVVRAREKRLAALMRKVAEALVYAHAHGVLHRDLKPNNILLTGEGEPLLTDFGLAKLTAGSSGLTLSTAVLGSPSYMSPEQAGGGTRDVTTAVDIYGLGAVLYELLTGQPPFKGANAVQTIRKVLDEEPVRPGQLNPAVSRDLETICLKCLEKVPERRYRSARALVEELERFARDEPIEARPVSTGERTWRWCRRKPAIAALSGIVIVAVLTGLSGVFWQWRRAERSRTETQQANTDLRRTLGHLEWRNISALVESDYAGRALAHLAQRLRQEPANWQAATFALSILEQRAFAMPAGPVLEFPEGLSALPPIITPKGERVITAGLDHAVRFWDVASGKETLPAIQLESRPVALILSPDGDHLVIATEAAALIFLNPDSGRELARQRVTSLPVTDLQFSADGQVVVVAGGTNLQLWTLREALAGGPSRLTIPHDFTIGHLRLSREGARVLTWGQSSAAPFAVWDTLTGKRLLAAPPGVSTQDAALDAAGERVATVSGWREISVWGVNEQRRLTTITDEPSFFETVLLTPDATRVVGGHLSGWFRGFDTRTGFPITPPMRHLYNSSSAVLDESGKRLMTGSQDFRARVWDLATGSPLSEPILHFGPVVHVAHAARVERLLVAARKPGSVARRLSPWNLRETVAPAHFQPPEARDLTTVRLSPDGKYVVVPVRTPGNAFWVYDTATQKAVAGPIVLPGDAYAIEFTPDQRQLLIAMTEGWVCGWSTETWQPLWPALKQKGAIQPAALSPDGKIFATGGPDGFLRLYDVEHGRLLRELNSGSYIKGIRFSPAGECILTGSANGTAALWDVGGEKPLVTFKGHTAEILSVEFSPDGKRAVTASYDGTVRLWDCSTGRELAVPLQHQAEASHATFSPDGRKVATCARDGTARIWDARTGKPLVEWMHHQDTVQTVNFDREGRRLLTFDHSGFRLWDAETGEPITLHYHSAVNGGLGVDSPTTRELFSRDGRQVFLGCVADAATLWEIPNPPPGAPGWFPAFLEAVAHQRLGSAGEYLPVESQQFLALRREAEAFTGDNYYEAWVRWYFGWTSQHPR